MTAFRHILPPALCLALLAACTQAVRTVEEEAPRVSVRFVAGSPSRTAMDDAAVRTLDFLAFRTSDGLLDCWTRTPGSSIEASVSADVELEYHLFANAPEGAFAGVTSLSTLGTAASWRLDGCDGECLPMEGGGTAVFRRGAPSESVPLTRIVSRVMLDRIVTRFSDGLGGADVTVVRVFLVNVCAEVRYTGERMAGGLWLNCLAPQSDLPPSVGSLLVAERGTVLTDPGEAQVGAVLYCCPNPVDNGVTSKEEPQWSPRNTRMVVELLIGGQTHYYPVTLPEMYPNKSYVVRELVLLGGGSSDPDIPVERHGLSFSMEVQEWSEIHQDVPLE